MDLQSVRIILSAIFLCVGTVGNILSVITVSNKHCKSSSYTVYLAGLAIVDLLALYTSIIVINAQHETFGINPITTSSHFCKVHVFLLALFTTVSIWLTVILSLERTFAVYFPVKVKSECKPKTAFIITALVVTFFIAFHSHYIYGLQLQSGTSQNCDILKSSLNLNASTSFGRNENASLQPFEESVSGCLNNDDSDIDGISGPDDTTALLPNHTKPTPIPRNQDNANLVMTLCEFVDHGYVEFYLVWITIDSIFFFWLPVLILITANTATWVKVYRSSRTSLTSPTALAFRRTRHVLILTSLISVGFLIFSTPMTVVILTEAVLADDPKYIFYNGETLDVLQLISEYLYLCNFSFNFFLYILSGKRFRKSLKTAFCKYER